MEICNLSFAKYADGIKEKGTPFKIIPNFLLGAVDGALDKPLIDKKLDGGHHSEGGVGRKATNDERWLEETDNTFPKFLLTRHPSWFFFYQVA